MPTIDSIWIRILDAKRGYASTCAIEILLVVCELRVRGGQERQERGWVGRYGGLRGRDRLLGSEEPIERRF